MVALQPESQWQVSRSGDEVAVAPPQGGGERMKLAAITRVVIVTNDTGPFGTDVWWMLVDDAARRAVGYPQGATGEKDMLDWLVALPGFDHDAMIAAMASTENDEFLCWERAGSDQA
jgi:hypothetical protein